MPDWREKLLEPFVRGVARKTIVSDPDELFRDDRLFRVITDRGFTVIYFEDSISFRFTYESQFREAWDAGEDQELVVIVKPETCEREQLPADLIDGACDLAFNLKDIFPFLSYTVVSKLDRAYYDALFDAHNQYARQPLGEVATKAFILKHVFKTEPDLIRSESELLRALLQRHYTKQQVPALVDDHCIAVLTETGLFADWPLKTIVPERGAFWDFLQERWSLFVHAQASGQWEIKKAAESVALKYPGALKLPFDAEDVRIYIDNLFTEGILRPIQWIAAAAKATPWVQVGMRDTTIARKETRFDEICATVETNIPAPDATVQTWLTFAPQYAQMQRLWSENLPALASVYSDRLTAIRHATHERFAHWLSTTYRGIYNYPSVTPVMVHHIPAFLANRLSRREAYRVALIIVDGLALDQWSILNDRLQQTLPHATIQENALMAWVPTITPVSRQAAFSGRIPLYFPDTINRTNRDETGWRQFWSDRGMQPDEVAFWTAPGDPGDARAMDAVLHHRTRVLGATIFKVDKIMHGVELGAAGMASQVHTWAEQGFLAAMVQRLIGDDFHVYLSADHGNVCAQGIGTPREGTLAETRGERCRVYTDTRLRASAQQKFPGTIPWDHQGLPKDYHALLAPADKAFVTEGQTVVCHGGTTIDEVVVPFIEIARRKVTY